VLLLLKIGLAGMLEFVLAGGVVLFAWLCYLAGKIDGFKEGFDKAEKLLTSQDRTK
jgi:hypothetical protein